MWRNQGISKSLFLTFTSFFSYYVRAQSECGGVLDNAGHQKQFLVYKLEESYSANERCVWTVRVSLAGRQLMFVLNDAGFNNPEDYIEVFRGDGTHFTNFTVNDIGETVNQGGSDAIIVFKSGNVEAPGRGFNLTYYASYFYPPNPTFIYGESYIYNEPSGYLNDYPQFGLDDWSPHHWIINSKTQETKVVITYLNLGLYSIKIHYLSTGNGNFVGEYEDILATPVELLVPNGGEPIVFSIKTEDYASHPNEGLRVYWNLVPESGTESTTTGSRSHLISYGEILWIFIVFDILLLI